MPFTLQINPLPAAVDPSLQVTAYRIIQEALTTVIKHAPGSDTYVTVGGADGSMTLEIVNSTIAGDRADSVNRHISPPALAALTPREVDVLRLIARGKTNTQIGGELFITAATVKTHVVRILAKLGLHDRTQAAVAAYEHGLVPPTQAVHQCDLIQISTTNLLYCRINSGVTFYFIGGTLSGLPDRGPRSAPGIINYRPIPGNGLPCAPPCLLA